MARLTAALALSIEALINGGATIMLIQAAGGPPMLDWVARHSWVTWVAAIVCAAAHLVLSRRIPSAHSDQPEAVTRAWWTAYAVFTFVLWLIAMACTLATPSSSRI